METFSLTRASEGYRSRVSVLLVAFSKTAAPAPAALGPRGAPVGPLGPKTGAARSENRRRKEPLSRAARV